MRPPLPACVDHAGYVTAVVGAAMDGGTGVGRRDPAGEAALDDGLDRRWTPHRMAYIKGENKPDHTDAGVDCPFCRIPTMTDEDGLLVARGRLVYAVLNLYPYNSGHLLICPYRHVADYTELDDGEVLELGGFTQRAMAVLREAFAPHGFNIGINQGSVGGAGIAGHLHQHIVPRWGGDANFMPVIARTKTLPATLPQTRDALAAAWPTSS
jgi:ATP adenylyltransferase